MAYTKMSFRGRGGVRLGRFDTATGVQSMGYGKNFLPVGCGTQSLTMTINAGDPVDITETCSGNDSLLRRLPGKTAIEVSIELQEFSRRELAIAMRAGSSIIAGGTAADEDLGSPEVGDQIFLENMYVSSLVIMDSAGSPATLVLDTDYRIIDADHGSIEILNVTGYTRPLVADYTYGSYGNMTAMTEGAGEYSLIFPFINTADGNSKGMLIIPRLTFDPSVMDWLASGSDVAVLTLSGAALYVSELDGVENWSPFFRVKGMFED